MAAFILTVLNVFVRQRGLGVVTGADGVYKFPGAETGLLPDVGFYRVERRDAITDPAEPIPFAPAVAVEVASPDQTPEAMAAKARVYLRGGTRLVWIVWPQMQHIAVWHPEQLDGPVAMLRVDDTLDGEDVIPGFTYPVAAIFAKRLASS